MGWRLAALTAGRRSGAVSGGRGSRLGLHREGWGQEGLSGPQQAGGFLWVGREAQIRTEAKQRRRMAEQKAQHSELPTGQQEGGVF